MTRTIASAPSESATFSALDGHPYCALVTYRKSGLPVSTPVWFAVAGERLYVKTDTPSGKVRRIRNDARVDVAPCTARGRCLGEAKAGRARILVAEEEPLAERALRARYGLGRRLFGLLVEPVLRWRGHLPVYLEVTSTGARP